MVGLRMTMFLLSKFKMINFQNLFDIAIGLRVLEKTF